MSEFQQSPEYEEQEVVEVDMFEDKLIGPQQVGETTGLGPCLGVILYDKPQKKALIGHLPNPDHNLDSELLEWFKNFPDKQKVKVFLGGVGNSDYYDTNGEKISGNSEGVRQEILDTFSKYGIAKDQIHVNWTDESNEDMSLIMRAIPQKDTIEYEFMNLETGEQELIPIIVPS